MITSLTTVFAYLLFWLGIAIGLVGNLMFLAVVFRYSVTWFFACLFVPLADWIYFAFNVKRTWKPVVISIAGFLLACFGYWLGSFNFPG